LCGRFTGAGAASGAGISFPVGCVIMYGGATDVTVPDGWLLCDGQAVSRVVFSNLFAAIGTLYGIGDGATTFNLPDYQTSNSFPRGATNDAGRGTSGGLDEVTLTGAESGTSAHTHGINGGASAAGSDFTSNASTVENNDKITDATIEANADEAHENQPPFQDVHFLIHV